MTVCEMCGKELPLFIAIVEGAEVQVCANCGKFGNVLRRPVAKAAPKKAVQEVIDTVVEDYAERIRKAREKLGKTQKEFALMLTEKESVVQHIESGGMTPSIDMARKLEKLLKIQLVEEEKQEVVDAKAKPSGPLTIGDLLASKMSK